MEKYIGTWNDKGFGIKLSDKKKKETANQTNSFADDVLMMATSLKEAQKNDRGLQKIQKRNGSKSTQTNRKS